MAIDGNSKYLGRRIGTNPAADKPIYAVADPCASPGKQAALRIGTNSATGKPVYVEQECDAPEPAMGTKYLAKRIGTNPATGKEVFALRCQGCVCNSGLRVIGCSNVQLPGATVKVYDLDDNLIAEATSAANGAVTFEIPAAGNYRVVITAKRFVTSDQVRALTCATPGPSITLTPAEGYRCVPCCAPYPQPIEWGIELPGLGTFTVTDPEGDCTWNGQTTVDVPGSTNLYESMTEYADPSTYNNCLGGGSELSVLRRRIYCCETVPVGEMCASMATQMAYDYLAGPGNSFGRFGAFVLLDDLGIMTINAPFRLKIEHPISGGTLLRVGAKTLSPWILGDRFPEDGGCRGEAFNRFAWLDPTVPFYTLNTGADLLPGPSNPPLSSNCLATGTIERAVPEMDYGDFAVQSGTREEICYADEFTMTVPPFTRWPWEMESIRVFDPNAFPFGPMMMRSGGGPGPEAPSLAIAPRPLPESLRRIKLINACPHKLPRDPEAPGECGCIGLCAIGKGDLPEGRTSSRNCTACQAGELDAPSRGDRLPS